ncbi:MFS transporter [Streptomyces justiciae]|uniref:MFS transporter n=1 Tax=Streptomyces justiciae TaxID=2780140 RepID=UPI002118781D|nr:MFS transporter [Streptomyces justiciae]MCW8379758.1 MFS transporter [Streptomyces justiciae]
MSEPAGSDGQRFLWGVIGAFACFIYGYSSGIVAGAQLYITGDFDLGTTEQGAVVSIFLIGAAIGALAGRVSERIGRRSALGLSGVLFGVGLGLAVVAPGLGVLLVARTVQGLASGIASAVVPVYLSEISTHRIRGRLGSLNQLMVTAGLLVSYLVSLAFADAGDWRWMFGAGLVGVAVPLLGLPVMRESPAWTRRRATSAADTEAARASSGLRSLLTPGVRPALVTGLALCALQQLCGINAVMYFAPTIIQSTGLNASNSILYSVYIGALNLVMTLVSIHLVDRWGRRPLMLLSVGLMLVALIPLGANFVWDLPAHSEVALVCLLAYVAAFAIGCGPVVWLLLSEVFPPEQRSLGISVCTTVNWLANFLVNQFFLTLVEGIGQGQTFWLFGVVCLIGLVYVARFVPETKGRSDDEIAAVLHTASSRP